MAARGEGLPRDARPAEGSHGSAVEFGAAGRTAGRASILGVFDGMAASAITVHEDRCAKVRNRNVSCLRCADACTSGCISVGEGRLSVDSSKCVGCGTCATVCPTCALEARNPTDAELLRDCLAARDGDEVEIACGQALRAYGALADGSRAARVVCVGRVDESLLAALAARGVVRVSMACGCCEACAQRHGRATAQLVAETANALFEAWGAAARATVREGVSPRVLADGAAEDAARAAFEAYFSEPRACDAVAPNGLAALSDAGAGSAATPADGLAHGLARVMSDGTLPHFLPDRRERLLDSLAALGEPQGPSIRTRLAGCVVIDGTKCSSCRMCATFCPTGAISKFDDDDGTFGVNHYPGDCVKCGSCRDICLAGAISLLDAVRPAQMLGGAAHRYVMRPRDVELNNPHQILNTMRSHLGSEVYER